MYHMDRPHLNRRPRMLDVFCGEGGAAWGYDAAGFHVVTGVDRVPQPRYPFHFTLADAIDYLRHADLSGFDFIHASPPCQRHSDLQKQSGIYYEDFIPETRELLIASGKPYVIENVEGAPLVDPVWLCGAAPEFPMLRVIRHRQFESNVPLTGTTCPEPHPLVFTYDRRKAHFRQLDQDTSYVQVTGGGNCTVANKRAAMGMPWASALGCNEAIPPAYAEHIGRQIIAAL